MSNSGKKKKSEGNDVFSVKDLCHHIPRVMSVSDAMFPKWGIRYHCVANPGHGKHIILRENPNRTVDKIDLEQVANHIAQWARFNLVARPDLVTLMQHDVATKVAKSWLSSVQNLLLELPKTVAFKSDPELAFHRLPFDPEPCEDLARACPTWAEVLSRMGNADAFCMRVASMMDPLADRKQVVWISGPKDSGKSQIQAILGWLMGADVPGQGAYTSLDNGILEGQFWKAPLVGKRFCAVSEADPTFLQTSKFLSITGDGWHAINQKGEKVYAARLHTMFFFFTNKAPIVEGKPEIVERIIDCRIARVPVEREKLLGVDEYQALLQQEMPRFIGHCQALYAPHQGRRIPDDKSDVLAAVESFESEALDFLHQNFAVCEPEAWVLKEQIDEALRLSGKFLSNQQRGQWVEIWERNGVSRKRVNVKTKSGRVLKVTVYAGLKAVSESDKQIVRE